MSAVLNPSRDRLSERWFFSAMAVAMTAAVFVGFAPSFFLRPWFPEAAAAAPAEPVFYVHGVLFAAWMLLLVSQTALVAGRRVPVHRRLGSVGVGLAALMVVTGVGGALVAAARPGGFIGVPVPPLQFLAVPFTDMVLFAVLVGLAAHWRRQAQTHKRLMLLATVNLLGAAFARVPLGVDLLLAVFVLPDLFLLALVVWDVTTLRRLHPATLWGGAAIIVSQPLRLMVSETSAWLAFAEAAAGLVR